MNKNKKYSNFKSLIIIGAITIALSILLYNCLKMSNINNKVDGNNNNNKLPPKMSNNNKQPNNNIINTTYLYGSSKICITKGSNKSAAFCDLSDSESLQSLNFDINLATSCIASLGLDKKMQIFYPVVNTFLKKVEDFNFEEDFPNTKLVKPLTFADDVALNKEEFYKILSLAEVEFLERIQKKVKTNSDYLELIKNIDDNQNDSLSMSYILLTKKIASSNDYSIFKSIDDKLTAYENSRNNVSDVFNSFSKQYLSNFNSSINLKVNNNLSETEKNLQIDMVSTLFQKIMYLKLTSNCFSIPKDYRDIIYDDLEKKINTDKASSKLLSSYIKNYNSEFIFLSSLKTPEDFNNFKNNINFFNTNYIDSDNKYDDNFISSIINWTFEDLQALKNNWNNNIELVLTLSSNKNIINNKNLTMMEVIDEASDNLINLNPEEIIMQLTYLVSKNAIKYNFNKDIANSDKKIKNPLEEFLDYQKDMKINYLYTTSSVSSIIQDNMRLKY